VRSYLKIQDGCNSFCSFCVIPFARGKSRSLPVPALLSRMRELHAQGVQEIVLTGVHIGDYCDSETLGGPFLLEDLVEQVLRNTDIPRLRLSSLEPIELTDKLLEQFHNPRLCPHFHMSLQSLSTPVLQGMRRQYTADQVEWALKTIAEKWPQAFVGLDVITGFPGESEAFFHETYERLQAWPWTRIHVFPYSEREGTRATQLTEVVPIPVRRHRAKLLRELSAERYDQLAVNQLGQAKQVLTIKPLPDGYWRALSQDYWDVVVPAPANWHAGEIHQVRIQGYQRAQSRINGFLTAEVSA
jgi:threonylcarbamoyladenosine tRNA methylthiotransferase MtaB